MKYLPIKGQQNGLSYEDVTNLFSVIFEHFYSNGSKASFNPKFVTTIAKRTQSEKVYDLFYSSHLTSSFDTVVNKVAAASLELTYKLLINNLEGCYCNGVISMCVEEILKASTEDGYYPEWYVKKLMSQYEVATSRINSEDIYPLEAYRDLIAFLPDEIEKVFRDIEELYASLKMRFFIKE